MSYVTGMTARVSQVRENRSSLRAVPDSPLATVRDISTAPTYRRRIAALRAEAPADARRPHQPRTQAAVAPMNLRRFLAPISISVTATVFAIAAGLSLQPSAENIASVNRAVVAGDSVWSLAATVDTERSLEEVVADIYRLNALDGGLEVGQTILLPQN